MSQTNESRQPFIYRAGNKVPKDVIAVIVDPSAAQIPDSAFEPCFGLKTIKFHKGVMSIGERAFWGCIRLKYINLHESSVEIIHGKAFYECALLEVVKLPPSLKRINEHAFGFCRSLRIINLSTCSLLEVIDDHAFHRCCSLLAVYITKSRLRIGRNAFGMCNSLISAELPPTVLVHTEAFMNCRTLELRQPQIDDDSLIYEQWIQRSRESARYLQVRNDGLPIHKICIDTNTALDQLQSVIHSNNNIINHALQQTDELSMTALHVLCLNPNATPEMLKMVSNACPQAVTMQAEMVTHVEYDDDQKL